MATLTDSFLGFWPLFTDNYNLAKCPEAHHINASLVFYVGSGSQRTNFGLPLHQVNVGRSRKPLSDV